MLVFPHWRTELPGEGCRAVRWAPPERFSHYIARPMVLHSSPPRIEDEDSSGSSSPDRSSSVPESTVDGEVSRCEWRGCGAQFPGVARLSAHVARVHAHPHRDGLFYCGWRSCSRPQRGFNARYKMLVHVRTHTNERPHTCNQCQKSFSRAENLKIHLRSHSGEKPYVCPYEGCGKAYSNSSDRFKHTRTHTVDKPYCCKVPGCNKRYTDPSSLRKHVKTYKHFTPKETQRDSSDELLSPNMSPTYLPVNEMSPYQDTESKTQYIPYHSPPRCTVSPTNYNSMPLQVSPMRYPPALDQVTYLRPLDQPVYPLRVPSYEMSYLEYTQMYEHAYRNYYSSRMDYPVMRPSVGEKMYSYNEAPIQGTRVAESHEFPRFSPMEVDDKPLNLKCAKRIDCKPIEELVRRTDLPLDLSTKS